MENPKLEGGHLVSLWHRQGKVVAEGNKLLVVHPCSSLDWKVENVLPVVLYRENDSLLHRLHALIYVVVSDEQGFYLDCNRV